MNDSKYADLEKLIFKGFLSLKVRIKNINFVFKSINDLEYDKIVEMSGLKNDPLYLNKFYLNYLYLSIYMINGKNILNYRDSYYTEITSILNEFPSTLVKSIFDKLSSLFERSNAHFDLIESYSYEDISRYNWKSVKNTLINNSSLTGILGSEVLGLNQFQRYWTVLNLREDEKESFEEKYQLTKFLASFTDSKAVRKIDASDKVKEEEEKRRRDRIKDKGTEREKNYLSGPTDTREEIIKELEKQMKGEKDAHDDFIDKYEKDMRLNMLKQMKELKRVKEERRKTYQKPLEEARPISQEEMMERLNKSRKKSKIHYLPEIESEQRSKFLDMSNVTNEDVLEESQIMSKEEYNNLIKDNMFKSAHRSVAVDKTKIEEDYKKKQKNLAYKYGIDEGIEKELLDFPNLKDKK